MRATSTQLRCVPAPVPARRHVLAVWAAPGQRTRAAALGTRPTSPAVGAVVFVKALARCRLPGEAGGASAHTRAFAAVQCAAASSHASDTVENWESVFEEAEQATESDTSSDKLHDIRRVRNRAYLVGVSFKQQRPRVSAATPTLSIEESLDELAHLADTAGLEVCGRIHQNLSAPDNRTYVGSGKLEELLEQARSLDVDTLIFDDELRPSQARNVERVANAAGGTVRIVDRVELILDIFRQRAATREGFLQTQLARIEYQLPRLTRLWQHLERQTGGGGLATKGMGESQLEIDKRLLRLQATRIKEKLERVRTHRALHRMRRGAAPLPVVALCGYTSAGKSTLLNLLTNADAYTDPQLFATLDPTTRRATVPDSGQAVLITDTVGFIQKLPTQLVAAFRATLEEIAEASLVLHVVDASKADFAPHMAAVDAVLAQIDGVEHIPIVMVYNKIDLAADPGALRQRALAQQTPTVCVSALTGEGVEELWCAISAAIEQQTLVSLECLLPFDQGGLLGKIRRLGAVEREEYTDAGVSITAKVPQSLAGTLMPWRLS